MESPYRQTVWIEIPHSNTAKRNAATAATQQSLLDGLTTDIEKTWRMLDGRFHKYFAFGGSVEAVDFFRGTPGDNLLLQQCPELLSSLLKVVMMLPRNIQLPSISPPLRWYPHNSSPNFPGYFSNGCEGLVTYIHWNPGVSHDEGLDETGVKIFDSEGSIGALEIDFPAGCCTDSYIINSREIRPITCVHQRWGSEGRSIVCCEPHANSSVSLDRKSVV